MNLHISNQQVNIDRKVIVLSCNNAVADPSKANYFNQAVDIRSGALSLAVPLVTITFYWLPQTGKNSTDLFKSVPTRVDSGFIARPQTVGKTPCFSMTFSSVVV